MVREILVAFEEEEAKAGVEKATVEKEEEAKVQVGLEMAEVVDWVRFGVMAEKS